MDFYFLKFQQIRVNTDLLFSLYSLEQSRVQICGFLIFIGVERSSDFCFVLNFWSGADLGFFYFHKFSEQSGVRSRETSMIADSEQIEFSDLAKNLLSDKTD